MRNAKLFFSLFIACHAISSQAQTCQDYIPDDWPNSRYTDNGNGTITDNKTQLIWKQCSEGQSGASCATGSITTHTWQQALQLADATTFAGHSDWRLPNIKEFSSLAARNCHNPSINEVYFPSTPANGFWSSSPHSSHSNYAWRLGFGDGNDSYDYRYYNYRVRLVRGGQ